MDFGKNEKKYGITSLSVERGT